MTVEYQACPHAKVTDLTDDNDDRTRVILHCDTCETRWMGCKAKRLGFGPGVTMWCSRRGDNPDNAPRDNESWGPVGTWTHSILGPTAFVTVSVSQSQLPKPTLNGTIEGILFRTSIGEELYRQIPAHTPFHLMTCDLYGEHLPRSQWRLVVGDEHWRIKWYRLDMRSLSGLPFTQEGP